MNLKCYCGLILVAGLLGCSSADNGAPAAQNNPSQAKLYQPRSGTNQVDPKVVESYLETYRSKSDQELGQAMDETDYNKRAAAGRVRLERAHIPSSPEGVKMIQGRYLSPDYPDAHAYGFSLLGALAMQDIAVDQIKKIVLDYVESHPKAQSSDFALWALGESGSEEALEHFFRIASKPETYGPAARERSFCCISQCGRYSASTRYEKVPRILELGKTLNDSESQRWVIMALQDMVPGVRFRTLPEWEQWWKEQQHLRQAKK